MIENIFSILNKGLEGSVFISIAASFGWGILSILLSPCHLTSIPLVIGFINSRGKVTVRRTFILSLFFSLGILLTITLIGIITASLGKMMGNLGAAGNYIVAAVFFIFGLYLLDVIKMPFEWTKNISAAKNTKHSGIISALVLGILFGIGLGPCTFAFMAPVLGIVFNIASSNLSFAILLLAAFAAGHCIIIVLAGSLTAKVQKFLNWTDSSRSVLYLKKFCGVLVIAGGVYFIYTIY